MFKTLAFGLLTTALIVGTAVESVEAQSGNRQQQGSASRNAASGSSNRSSAGSGTKSAAYSQKQQSRQDAKTKLKLVGLIQRSDFAGITLTKAQRTALKGLVNDNFAALGQATQEMTSMVPEGSRRDFQNAFLAARKDGMSTMEALKMSVMDAELSEMVQEKVMMHSQSREEVIARITGGVTEMLTPEQSQTLADLAAAKMAAKGEMAKEEMAEGEMTKEEMTKEEIMAKKEMAVETASGSSSR